MTLVLCSRSGMDVGDNYEEKIALASYKSFNGLEN